MDVTVTLFSYIVSFVCRTVLEQTLQQESVQLGSQTRYTSSSALVFINVVQYSSDAMNTWFVASCVAHQLTVTGIADCFAGRRRIWRSELSCSRRVSTRVWKLMSRRRWFDSLAPDLWVVSSANQIAVLSGQWHKRRECEVWPYEWRTDTLPYLFPILPSHCWIGDVQDSQGVSIPQNAIFLTIPLLTKL